MTTPCGYVCDNKTSEGYCKTTGCINPKINGSISLTLNSPITEEQLDTITDVDLNNMPRVIFKTKHGKEVEYMKVVRCKDCKYWVVDSIFKTGWCNNKRRVMETSKDWFCADGTIALSSENNKARK